MQINCQNKNLIVKSLLKEWKSAANADLKGVSYVQIEGATGIKRQIIKNYLTLSGQKRFDAAIIETINEYRKVYRAFVQSLTIINE